jgi:hypothetical protein
MRVLVALCMTFCSARMYAGGFPSKDPKFCYCYEAVLKKTPAAMEPFALYWLPPHLNPEPQHEPTFSDWELIK